MAIKVLLVLFGPASQSVAVMVEESVTAELTHHERFLVLRFPLESIGFVRQTIVPPDVLVTSEHVEVLSQWIVDHLRRRVEVVTLHGGRKQARCVETSRVRDQVLEKRKTSVTERRLIRDRPNHNGSAVLVPRDHFAQLIASVFECGRVFP